MTATTPFRRAKSGLTKLLLLAAVGVLATGCTGFYKTEEPPARGYARDEVPFQFRVGWLPDQVNLANSQRADLELFLRTTDPRPGDRIVIEAAGPLATERQTAIATAFFDRGLTNVDFANNATGNDLSTVTVLRSVILPLACTTGLIGRGADGQRMMAPGCATELTLLNQVENPRDLTDPQPMGPPPGEAEAAAYRTWLEGRASTDTDTEADEDFTTE